MLTGFRWQHKGVALHDYELVTDVYLKYRAVSNCVCVCVCVCVCLWWYLSVTSGSCLRMSAEPMKMLSRWVNVHCTSNQMKMTESATDSLLCHDDTSSRKCPMYLDVMRFCSWTWLSSSVSMTSSSVRSRGTWVHWWGSYWNCIPACDR